MQFLGLTLPDLNANLALDEALLLQAEQDNLGETLRIWEWPAPAVVLGAGGIVGDDVDEVACQRDQIPLARRSSGGGTVLLGPGCLLFSLVLAYERDPALSDVTRSYRFILDQVCQMLDDVLPGCRREGSSDLAWGERKFSGNAQQRKRRFVLHHGTLLYACALEQITCYLKPPPRQPDYRRLREHGDFLMNVPLGAQELTARLRATWGASEEVREWPHEQTGHLIEERYGRDDWVRRR